MRNIFTIILCFALHNQAFSQQRYAMLAVAGATRLNNKAFNIHQDTTDFRDAMQTKGFNCTILNNASAAMVFSYLKRLINDLVKPGDQIVLGFRMHGEQRPDSGRKDEEDSLDEVLLAYDMPIYDDTINYFLNQLRDKVGNTGSVLLVVDACHSGSMDKVFGRDDLSAQILLEEIIPQNNISCYFSTIPTEQVQATYSLIVAFARAFRDIGEQTTFQGLFDIIRYDLKSVNFRNKPYAEGDLGRLILGIRRLPAQSHFTVLYPKPGNTGVFVINATSFDGIKDSTRVCVYVPDTYSFEGVSCYEAFITNITYTESEIVMPLADETLARGGWIFLRDESKQFSPIHLNMVGWNEKERKNVLQKSFHYEVILEHGHSNLNLSFDRTTARVILEEPGNESFRFIWTWNATIPDSIAKYLHKYAKARYLIQLREVSNRGDSLILDLNNRTFSSNDSADAHFKPRNDRKIVEFLLIEISPAYDIMVKGIVNSNTILELMFTPPYGQWYFKTFYGPDIRNVAYALGKDAPNQKQQQMQVQTFQYQVSKKN